MQCAMLWLLFGLAADPNPDPEQTDEERQSAGEEIVVTGSRIRSKDLSTAAPLTVITREQFETSGKISIGDFLQTLPSQSNAINSQVNNGGDGSVQINLRGLGAQRTLVLINGRRPATGNDLSVIPSAIVDRVEILQDGASAIYGSDAIGGVVNVITRRRFNGTEASAYGGVSPHGDGSVVDLAVTTGQGSDRGNVIFSAGFFDQGTIWAGDRSYSAVPYVYDYLGGTPLMMGSTTGMMTRVGFRKGQVAQPGIGSPLLDDLVALYPNEGTFVQCTPGAGCPAGWRPPRGVVQCCGWTLPSDPNLPGDGYNYQPSNYLVTPSRRLNATSVGEFSLGSRARAYYEASFVDRTSKQALAAQPIGIGSLGVTISKDNAYNPFGVDVYAGGLRIDPLGNRTWDQDLLTFRIVTGVDGSLPESAGPLGGLYWDVSFNHSRVQDAQTYGGLVRNTRLQGALGPTWRDASGALHCGSDAANDIPGCTPIDFFNGGGAVTADQAAYLLFTGNSKFQTQLTGVQVNAGKDLFRLFSERPAAVAFGYEYRMEYDAFTADPIIAAHETENDIAGDSYRAGQYVNEGYLELSLPIASALPGAELLELRAAGRAFAYSISGSGVTYKLGGRWQPIRDVTLRGTWSTAFRSPTIGDLYTPLVYFPGENFGVVDPCAAGVEPGSALARSCGGAANNAGDPSVTTVSAGGNRALAAETAAIFTAGVVLEPRFLRNFSATVDYYRYRVDQSLTGGIDPRLVLDKCYPSADGVAPSLCDRVQRDATGALLNVNSQGLNIGTILTDGIDVALRYALGTPAGRFGLSFDGNWLHRYDVEQPDGTVWHARGTTDVYALYGGIYPSIRFNAGASWSWSGLTVAANTRYIGSFKECGDSGGIGPVSCAIDSTYSRRVSHSNTWDLFASYALDSPLGKSTVAFGVNNLFDRPPPFLYSMNATNSDPATYDFIGRFVYARVVQRF